MREYLELLKKQFNDRIRFSQKRDGVFQLIAPFYHEDGDMLDVYMETLGDNGRIFDIRSWYDTNAAFVRI